jgi:hypothetical protein
MALICLATTDAHTERFAADAAELIALRPGLSWAGTSGGRSVS